MSQTGVTSTGSQRQARTNLELGADIVPSNLPWQHKSTGNPKLQPQGTRRSTDEKIRALALSSESTLTEGFHVANRQGLLSYSVVLCALCGKGLVFRVFPSPW